jgi:stage III sporulation protein SpoIIIAA
LNNINIDRSVIGMLNAGQIQDVQNISVNVTSLVESGNSGVAQALKNITEAVAASQEVNEEQRSEILDQLDELSSQAALPSDKRAKLGVIKAVLASLATTLGAAGGLAEVWSTWGPAICTFFGV